MRRMIPALIVCLAASLPAAALAETRMESSGIVPPEIAEASKSVMRLFSSMISAIPTYEAPELLPNGDIIIRRKNPEAEASPAPEGDAPSAKPVPTQI